MTVSHLRSATTAAALCLTTIFGGTEAVARRVVVDTGLTGSIYFYDKTALQTDCNSSQCVISLPYRINIGGGFTNKLYTYQAGIISVGRPLLPDKAFSDGFFDPDGEIFTSTIDYYLNAGHHIIAPGFFPSGDKSPYSSPFSGVVSKSTIRQWAVNEIDFCTIGIAPGGSTVCPEDFREEDRFGGNPAFIEPFIAANNLDSQFVGNIILDSGQDSGLIFSKPKDGFVDVELFQGFSEPYYIGLANDLDLYDDVQRLFFSYRFAVQSIPEPGTWLTMIAGFGLIGAVSRRARHGKRRAALVTASLS